MNAAERQRRHRQRAKDGLMVVRVTVHDVAVPEMLVEAKFLAEGETGDRFAVAAAIEALLRRLTEENRYA